MVSKQKENNEGYNKHTRRVVNNNTRYLQRNFAREVNAAASGAMARPGRFMIEEAAELARREDDPDAEMNRIGLTPYSFGPNQI